MSVGHSAPDEAEPVAKSAGAVGERLLQVMLDAVLPERRRLSHLVGDVAQHLVDEDLEPVLGLARALADDEALERIAFLLDHRRRRHPVERLVAARVRMDEDRAVGLEHEQPVGLGQDGRQAAGVEHLAAGDDQAHGRRPYRPFRTCLRTRAGAPAGYAQRMSRFLERLAQGAVVADGGTGALLSAAAAPRLRCPEEANLKAPEAVIGVHLGFIRAGAELIEANTFGANRRKLSGQFLDERSRRSWSGASSWPARRARSPACRCSIGGSIGPLATSSTRSAPRTPTPSSTSRPGCSRDGASTSSSIETFYDIDELETAIHAVQRRLLAPIVAQLTFDEDAQTLAGSTAREAIERLQRLDVAAAGANCGLGLQAASRRLGRWPSMRTASAHAPSRTSACPAGRADGSSTRTQLPTTSPSSPRRRAVGAGIVGGCCGTTPAQIAALRAAVEEGRQPRVPLVAVERDVAPGPPRYWAEPSADALETASGSSRSSSTRPRGRTWRRCSRSRAGPGVCRGARRRHQRQPHGAGAPRRSWPPW